MARFVDTQPASAGQGELDQTAPPHVLDLAAGDAAVGHVGDQRVDVVAHQVDLVPAVVLGRMHGDLRRRETEDEPAVADVDVGQLDDVPEKGPIGVGVRAEDHCVGTVDHLGLLPIAPVSSHHRSLTAWQPR